MSAAYGIWKTISQQPKADHDPNVVWLSNWEPAVLRPLWGATLWETTILQAAHLGADSARTRWWPTRWAPTVWWPDV